MQQIASLSPDVQFKLKHKIPEIKNVKRSLKSIQNRCRQGWCCLTAEILYEMKQFTAVERAKQYRHKETYLQVEKGE